jgi:hypothetical protein
MKLMFSPAIGGHSSPYASAMYARQTITLTPTHSPFSQFPDHPTPCPAARTVHFIHNSKKHQVARFRNGRR